MNVLRGDRSGNNTLDLTGTSWNSRARGMVSLNKKKSIKPESFNLTQGRISL